MLEAQPARSGQELDFTQKLTGIGPKRGQHFVILQLYYFPSSAWKSASITSSI